MMSTKNLPKSLQLIFKILKILGCWRLEKASVIYRLYTVLLLSISFVSLFATEIIYIIQVADDLEKLTDAIFLPLTYFAMTIKLVNFFRLRSKVDGLIKLLNISVFRPKNNRQFQILSKRMATVKITYIFFLAMAMGTITLWAIFPIIEMSSENTAEKILPVRAWYPFNQSASPWYELAYIHQIIAIAVNATINISLDCLSPGFMAYTAAQLELLSNSIENITTEIEANLEKKYKTLETGRGWNLNKELLNEPNLKQEFYEKINEAQINCVVHHMNILRLSKDINSIFSLPTLGQLSISVFTICVTLFQLTLVSPMSIQFVSMVLYQGCMLMEIFLFCWYGNEIILKSGDLLRSVYNSNWTDCPTSYKRNMLIIMMRTQKPMKMYAGNFFILSLETFCTILRSSWSYFAVLQQVHNK